jgi:hypothetical protein
MLEERRDGINGNGKDRRRIFFGGDFNKSLQIAELQGGWIPADHVGRIGQPL